MLTVRNESIEEYYLNRDYLCLNDLKLFLKSPRVYFYSQSKDEFKTLEKKENKFEYALNLFLFDRTDFNNLFSVSPKFDKRTKQGKLDYSNFISQNYGKLIIDEAEFEAIKNIHNSLMTTETFNSQLENNEMQSNISCYVLDETTGLKFKFRCSFYSEKSNFASNIILCLSSSIDDLKYLFSKNNIDFEASIICQVLGVKKLTFLCCETTAPYQSSFVQLKSTVIAKCKTDYRMVMDLLKWSIDNNFWCNYTQFEVLKSCYKSNKMEDAMSKLENEILTLK